MADDTVHVETYRELYSKYVSLKNNRKWKTERKPRKSGRYMVTIDTFGYLYIDIFYYGEPLMPNIEVDGMCWYRSDDEWGDVVYDDKEILAWMPLPKPYKKEDKE